jgi:hypothetical protein
MYSNKNSNIGSMRQYSVTKSLISDPIKSMPQTQFSNNILKQQQEEEKEKARRIKAKEDRDKLIKAYGIIKSLESPEKQYCNGYICSNYSTEYSANYNSYNSVHSVNSSNSEYNSSGVATPL